MADSGKVPHSIIFHENEGCGALALALAFLSYLNCKSASDGDSCGQCNTCNQISKLIYPDIHFVFPVAGEKVTAADFKKQWRELYEKNPYFTENDLYAALEIEKKSSSISVVEAKSILNLLSISSYSDGYRAVIIWLPEKMQVEASNRLLKIVEEPSEKTIFMFITHAPEKVLKTITSRCQLVRVLPATKEEIAAAIPRYAEVDSLAADYAAEYSSGSMGVALRSLSEHDENVQMYDIFTSLLDAIMSRDLMTALEVGEEIAALDSREKQKAFCKFASSCIRKIYMLQQNMPDIAGVRPDEKEFYTAAAAKCGPNFCSKATTALNRSYNMVVRNVNQKIVFTTLVSRLFYS